MSADCTADLDHPCDAGGRDDNDCAIGCADCRAEEAFWRDQWEATSHTQRRVETMTGAQLNAELIDAGRGHLVRQ